MSSGMATKFEAMQTKNSNFVAVIDQLTPHTYVQVVASNPYNSKFNTSSSLKNNM